jgi:hypothetical protein
MVAFLNSRAHVYMEWQTELLPALRSGHAAIIRRWLAGDRVTAGDASKALVALVDAAQPARDAKARTGQGVAEVLRALTGAGADANALAARGEDQSSPGLTLLMQVRMASQPRPARRLP